MAKAKSKSKPEPKPEPKSGPGRKPDPHEERWMLRHHAEQYNPANTGTWQVAAMMSGLDTPEWARRVLDAEAAKATHVPELKRRAS